MENFQEVKLHESGECVGVRNEREEEGRVRGASQISHRGDVVNDDAN